MIVRLTGGLGNQFFGYAFGKSLSIKRNEPIQFYFSQSTIPYALDPYNVDVQFSKPFGFTYDEKTFAFDPDVYNTPLGAHYRGYWQTEKYFDEPTIRKHLTLRNPVSKEIEELAEKIRNTNSVFIHRRHGDYLNPGTFEFHGIPSETYYSNALNYIKERIPDVEVFSFSDNPAFRSFRMLTMHEDLYLMSQCKHGIAANSTFSFWAGWLRDYSGKIIITPKQWFINSEIDTSDLIPDRWIRL